MAKGQVEVATERHDLFLSHASVDKDWLVRPVAQELMRRGLSVWLDEGEIYPGMLLEENIKRGLETANAVVLFITPAFLQREWPQKELHLAIEKAKPLIPVVVGVDFNKLRKRYPLLCRIYIMTGVKDPAEIARRIEQVYKFMMTTRQPAPPDFEGPLDGCIGVIRLPKDGSSVDRHIVAEGNVTRLPESASLWLVCEIGGLKWPKEPGVFVWGNAWIGEAYEGGQPPGGRLTLSLYVAGEEGSAQICNWLEQGRRWGHYPGLAVLKDARKLHSIELRLRDF